ncbi:hypothetical protein JF818_14910, partial [Sphaerochaeta sp. S2]|nr:hypothetical protein [Sphaerochaeta sp. S2]
MKKKFVLTLALVLMVAAAVVAAPLEVSGSFEGGYKFTFEDDGDKKIEKAGDQASIDAVAAFTGDFWKLSLAGGAVMFDNDMEATLEVYLDKALAEQGVDMGDVSLKYAIGNKKNLKPSDVYGDSNDAVAELEMLGNTYSALVTLGYADLVTVEFGADPTDATNKPIMAGVKVMPVDGVSAAFG